MIFAKAPFEVAIDWYLAQSLFKTAQIFDRDASAPRHGFKARFLFRRRPWITGRFLHVTLSLHDRISRPCSARVMAV
jgi:hypothetical protein